MWTLQLFSFEFGPRSYVTCICTSTGSYSCCVHIPHHHLSVRVDGSSIETLSLCWSYLFLLLAAPFSLNVRSLKGLSRPSNRRRHGNRWKILKGLRRLRWQNTYISEGLLNWTRRCWTEGNLGRFGEFSENEKDDVGTFLLWTYAITINLCRF